MSIAFAWPPVVSKYFLTTAMYQECKSLNSVLLWLKEFATNEEQAAMLLVVSILEKLKRMDTFIKQDDKTYFFLSFNIFSVLGIIQSSFLARKEGHSNLPFKVEFLKPFGRRWVFVDFWRALDYWGDLGVLLVKPFFRTPFAARPRSHREYLQYLNRRSCLREDCVSGEWFGNLTARLGFQIYQETVRSRLENSDPG